MENNFNRQRRKFLKNSLIFGSLIATQWLKPTSIYAECSLTPPETSGPFYPLSYPLDENNDLTSLNKNSHKAKGEIIYLKGVVRDTHCRPISKALVEIWQACASGRYNHPEDRNKAELDPNFQYWGKAITNDNGEYKFKTIKPGSYPVNWFWTRPPHIHFSVRSSNHSEFTTQMYFAQEPLNDKDKLLQNYTKKEKEQCIVTFRQYKTERIGKFNLTLRS